MRTPGVRRQGRASDPSPSGLALTVSAGSPGIGFSFGGVREGRAPGPSRFEAGPGLPAPEERRRDDGRTTSDGSWTGGRPGWVAGGEAQAQGLPGDALREEGG